MESTDKHGTSTMRKVALALLAGLVVFVLLFYWGGGTSSDPPTCFGMFGLWTVPCGWWPAAAGALTAGVLWLALWWWDRRM
jgi:hypothetical protein